jgi:hypothetical protein
MNPLGYALRDSDSASPAVRVARGILENKYSGFALERAADGVFAQVPQLGKLARRKMALEQTGVSLLHRHEFYRCAHVVTVYSRKVAGIVLVPSPGQYPENYASTVSTHW